MILDVDEQVIHRIDHVARNEQNIRKQLIEQLPKIAGNIYTSTIPLYFIVQKPAKSDVFYGAYNGQVSYITFTISDAKCRLLADAPVKNLGESAIFHKIFEDVKNELYDIISHENKVYDDLNMDNIFVLESAPIPLPHYIHR